MIKRIFYIHGLGSTKESNSVRLLRKYLPEYEIMSEDIAFNPNRAAHDAERYPAEKKADLVVGSSLGGFYGQFAPGKKIFINPCLNPKLVIGNNIDKGVYEYFGPREDGIQEYEINDEWLNEVDDVYNRFEEIIESKHKESDTCLENNTYIFIGDHDELIDRRDVESELRKNYSDDHIFEVYMGHRIEEEFVKGVLVPFIRKILGE